MSYSWSIFFEIKMVATIVIAKQYLTVLGNSCRCARFSQDMRFIEIFLLQHHMHMLNWMGWVLLYYLKISSYICFLFMLYDLSIRYRFKFLQITLSPTNKEQLSWNFQRVFNESISSILCLNFISNLLNH